MNDIELIDPDLERHLRRTLAEVARTVTGDAIAERPELAPRSRRRRAAKPVAIACAALGLAAAAFAWANVGPEYVKELPPRPALAAGTADGIRWWLVPSFHTNVCDQAMPGVEAVTAARNPQGAEWSTFGVSYGEPSADPCAIDEAAWLRDPNRMEYGLSRMGPDDDSGSPWIAAIALHPSATKVLVTIDGATREIPTLARSDRPGGPRYVTFTAPADTKNVRFTPLGSDGVPVAAERTWSP